MGRMTPHEVAPAVARLDDDQSRDLVAFLRGLGSTPDARAWREVVNGRWVCFLTRGDQTYCLLPLSFTKPEGVP